MKIQLYLLAFFISFQFILFAQPTGTLTEASPESVGISSERLKRVDNLIQSYVDGQLLPGGVFLVARKGKIVYHKSFGKRSLDKEQAYQNSDIFRLASMTKAFTTVAIMQLYEQGQLGLDDPIYHYLPAYKEMAVLDEFNSVDSSYTTTPATQPITIRHLLTHTSGITYGGFNPGKIQIIYNKLGVGLLGLSHPELTTQEMVNMIATVPLVFEPGQQYMYGLNMEVLGGIVEVISGMTLRTYFNENIFQPLGLKDTDFYLSEDKHKRLVPLYTVDQEGKWMMAKPEGISADLNYPNSSGRNHFAGGGGLSGTALDYAIFIQALLNNGAYNGKRILGRKTIETMTADQLIVQNRNGKGYSPIPGLTYGLGFALRTKEATGVGAKSPGTYEWGGYFNTKFFIDPEEEMIFVGMTQVLPFVRQEFWERLYTVIYGAIED